MIPAKKIRVLVVDDSITARTMIIQGLNTHPKLEVVGSAINTLDAKKKIEELQPDVVTMDVEMPGQSGTDFLKSYIPEHPIPVVLCSSLDLKVFDALEAGAVDFVRKPFGPDNTPMFITALVQKVIIAAAAKVRPSVSVRAAAAAPVAPIARLGNSEVYNNTIIGLGASTGGTDATLEVMKRLPADIPGMIIVQHMPPGFTKMYADRLNRLCQMEVREAVDGDEIRRGLALVAPADLQARVMRINGRYVLSCKPGEKVSGHRPSVDALFHSMAEVLRVPMVGIIMTGMGQDGAAGLLAMRQQGAYTIGQNKESCVVYGMPRVAYEMGAVCTQVPCDAIADTLIRQLKTMAQIRK